MKSKQLVAKIRALLFYNIEINRGLNPRNPCNLCEIFRQFVAYLFDFFKDL